MDEADIRQLRQPTQCVLWDKPELVGQPAVTSMFETVETFVDTSHLERTLFKCRECGQLYFYEYYEHVDFGDEASARQFIRIQILPAFQPAVIYTPHTSHTGVAS